MSSQVVTPNTEAAILARILLESEDAKLSPEAVLASVVRSLPNNHGELPVHCS
jgi:hypothetical protein